MVSTTRIILAIDIGSSSVRCSAYEVSNDEASHSSIKSFENCRASRTVQSVRPNTGKIQLMEEDGHKSLMDNLDDCIDELLEALRQKKQDFRVEVEAVAFSSFVMNLVGVDTEGGIVGDDASISYACNSPPAAKQCRALRRYVSVLSEL